MSATDVTFHTDTVTVQTFDFLSSFAALKCVGVETAGPQRYRSLSDDPQLIFKPLEPIPAGWYEIQIDLACAAGVRPQLFFDFGGGFNEMYSLRLKHKGGERYAAIAKLPYPALLVRLDPSDGRYDFALNGFEAKTASLGRVSTMVASHSVKLFANDPYAFLVRVPEFWRALHEPRFIQLRENLRRGNKAADYAAWIRRYDYHSSHDRSRIVAQIENLSEPPLISVVMPVYNTPESMLDEAIESVVGQVYPHWELCIADDRSTKGHVRACLRKWQERDERIKIVFREENGHISHATNSAFELATGEWIALLDHDDLLREHALAEVALEIARHPDAELIYSDEDKIDTKGKRYEPFFKPDFSRELFRSQNYLNHLTVHRAQNIRAAGGWRPGFEGSQDYDLNLRIFERIAPGTIRHIPKVLYHWRAAEGSTAAAGSEKSYAFTAGLRALEEHVERIGLDARVEAAPDTPFYRLRPVIPNPAPLVSLIIPTRDKVELLRGCIETIRTKTTYPNYEILVLDNGSSESETLAYFKELEELENVRVVPYDKPFNYSAINNYAVERARGEIVGLVNNDIEVISPEWLGEMVSWAIQPDVGCVGAKLYYANDTIQHAGVIIGIGGVAGHSHKYFPRDDFGYFSRLKVLQNLSAVTAACLLVRKSVYEEVGGLDEVNLTVAFNDVDFCLRVRKAGYLNVWTPYAELYHLESISRGAEDSPEKIARFAKEREFMEESWGTSRVPDIYYSRNLTLENEDFSYVS